MKLIPTFAALLLANTCYADYSVCSKGPYDGKTGRCVMHHDNGNVRYADPTRVCLKTRACNVDGRPCVFEGDHIDGIWYAWCDGKR
ncbi:hypothetical protein Vi05172_g9303 [Venturia inaequalis]|nr:hypothetical protein Vi05172_g9303 [Venturia inaequalis]